MVLFYPLQKVFLCAVVDFIAGEDTLFNVGEIEYGVLLASFDDEIFACCFDDVGVVVIQFEDIILAELRSNAVAAAGISDEAVTFLILVFNSTRFLKRAISLV